MIKNYRYYMAAALGSMLVSLYSLYGTDWKAAITMLNKYHLIGVFVDSFVRITFGVLWASLRREKAKDHYYKAVIDGLGGFAIFSVLIASLGDSDQVKKDIFQEMKGNQVEAVRIREPENSNIIDAENFLP